MQLRGNAKLWQMSKKVTDFLWIRFIILSDDYRVQTETHHTRAATMETEARKLRASLS
jgi:hypothetical protein